MLGYLAEHAAELTTQYGNVSKATIGTIQRQLLVLENQGGTKFFGEPALALKDLMQNEQRRPRLRQHPGRRQADGEPAALRDVPAVAVVGAVRAAARGRRSRQAEARVLLRRGASAVQRCAEGAARPDRAGGAADPLQGRRRVLRHAEPDRRAGQGAGPARQPRAACAARVHAARPEGGRGGGADVPAQSQARHRPGHHRTRQGRGAGVVPRRQRHAVDGRARHGASAVGAHRPDHAGGARQRSRARAR